MSIVFGKLIRKLYESSNGYYHIYTMRVHGGKRYTAIFRRKEAPKPFKTVEYMLQGEWAAHPDYGKQFEIEEFERSKVNDTSRINEAKDLVAAIKHI